MYKYICKECGKEFEDSKRNRKYCSSKCRINAHNKDYDNKIIGNKFGKLTAIRFNNRKTSNGQRYYECYCECGNIIITSGYSLLKGLSKSCGCSRKETCSQTIKIPHKKFKEKNLVEGTSLSQIKANFKNNTSGVKGVFYDKTNKSWVGTLTYKGNIYKKGFKGSEEDDIAKEKAIQYRKNLEEKYFQPILDKYTKKQQGKKAKLIEYQGEEHTLTEWSNILDIKRVTLQARYNKNPNDLDYVFCKERLGKIIEYNGEKHNFKEWAKILGISYATIFNRYKKNPNDLDYIFSTKKYSNEQCVKNLPNYCLIKLEYQGEEHTLTEWSRILGIKYNSLYRRFKRKPNDLDYVFSRIKNNEILVEYQGKKHNLKKWADILGINYGTLKQRYKKRPNDLDYIFRKK